MAYPIEPPIEPMLAALQREIPRGDGWLYEPKWDGFRAIVFRDGEKVHIGSRNELPLERYFPDVVECVKEALPARAVADGEIVLPGDNGLDFEMLQLRLHPAESRVRKLAAEIPATYVAFDLLATSHDLRELPFATRRARLEKELKPQDRCFLTPQTSDPDEAERWFEMFEGAGLDGVVAKRAEMPYVPGQRVMVKVKHERTADCVVGGYRLAKDRKGVGSLLLGLYGDDGLLNYVGFTSSFRAPERVKLREMLRPLETTPEESFGVERAPGGPSRWNQGRDQSWIPLKPQLVCEVAFDHLQGYRFRHGTTFRRWRSDRRPKDCTWDQFTPPKAFDLADIRALSERS
ncbi:MAG: ATP-dependent DNA ligase [Actinomycetota bacterium]